MNNRISCLILGCLLCYSCINKSFSSEEQKKISEVVNRMIGQPVFFPQEMSNNLEIDSLLKKDQKLIVYIDSAGCTECHLSLDEWSVKIREIKFVNKDVAFIFIINNSNESVIRSLLNKHRFNYPVFIDQNNSFFKMNSLNKERRFQSFLLDKDNSIMLVGDPIQKDQIWKLYKKALNGGMGTLPKINKDSDVNIDTTIINLGDFTYDKVQRCTFTLQNIGKKLLVIDNVSTSCGCISVQYSKEPIRSGKSLNIIVIYKADHPEHFNKVITVYCNAAVSPIVLRVQGNAK